MPTQNFNFTGHSGEELAARLETPTGPTLAYAIFAHCFTCSKDLFATRRISQHLTNMGIAVLRFDFTGLGKAEGDFEHTNFTSNVADLIAAATALRENFAAPSLLIGHSLGGAAVLKAASQINDLKGVVTIGAPADPGHVVHNFGPAIGAIEENGRAEVNLGGRPFYIAKQFLDDVSEQSLEDSIKSMKAALLVLHGPRDQTVGIENAGQIFAAAKHPKSFVTLDDADHLVSRAEDAIYVANVIGAWATKYIDLTPPKSPEIPEGILRVSETAKEGFLQDIYSGKHHIIADEPISFGGADLGLTPYGLLSAGLGACTSMTIRMYARRKKLNLEHVSVDVSHNKCHATDTQSETGGQIDCWHREIKLVGNLTDDERQRLLEIADKCPVHKTLERSSRVTTSLSE